MSLKPTEPKIKTCKICGATESPKWDGRVCRDCKVKRDSEYYQAKRAAAGHSYRAQNGPKQCKQCGTTESVRWHGRLCRSCVCHNGTQRYITQRDARTKYKAHPSRSWMSGEERRCRQCGATEAARWQGRLCGTCVVAYGVAHNRERRKVDANFASRCQENSNRSLRKRYAEDEEFRERTKRAAKTRALTKPEEVKATYNRYAAKNPEVLRANFQARRARKRNAEGRFTSTDWKQILERQEFRCIDCGRSDLKLTIGHAVPLCLGGSNWPSNILAQCMPCNHRQGRKIHHSVH